MRPCILHRPHLSDGLFLRLILFSATQQSEACLLQRTLVTFTCSRKKVSGVIECAEIRCPPLKAHCERCCCSHSRSSSCNAHQRQDERMKWKERSYPTRWHQLLLKEGEKKFEGYSGGWHERQREEDVPVCRVCERLDEEDRQLRRLVKCE
jgi:predicted lipoprotein with Yx(FWY)xxD motif